MHCNNAINCKAMHHNDAINCKEMHRNDAINCVKALIIKKGTLVLIVL